VTGYVSLEMQGFRVFVDKRLAAEGQDQAKAALTHLDSQLAQVVKHVPEGYHGLLRDVPVWVEAGDPGAARFTGARAGDVGYIPLDAANLRFYGVLPTKAGGIEVFAAWRLVEPWASWWQECAPGWLLHEFAHALHDRALGFDDAGVAEAYRQAVERRLYDDVEIHHYRDYGRYVPQRGPAYARSNHREYFAELSVAYLGLGKRFFPFTREELQKHDPIGYALVADAWRPVPYIVASGLPETDTLYRLGPGGQRWRLFDLAPGKLRVFDGWPHQRLLAVQAPDGPKYRFDAPADANAVWRLRAPAAGSSTTRKPEARSPVASRR
jgi:hypothetical protein